MERLRINESSVEERKSPEQILSAASEIAQEEEQNLGYKLLRYKIIGNLGKIVAATGLGYLGGEISLLAMKSMHMAGVNLEQLPPLNHTEAVGGITLLGLGLYILGETIARKIQEKL